MAAQAVQPFIYAEQTAPRAHRQGTSQPAPRRSTQPVQRRSRKAIRRARALAVLFVLLVAALVLLFPRVVHTQSHSEMVAISYTVAPGDTLWEIAAAHAGNRDVREVIHEIEQVNRIKGVPIQPGQVLIIPAAPGTKLAGR